MAANNRLILTADPDFLDLALNEFQRGASDGTILATPAPDIALVQCTETFVDLAERWRETPPIFVRHICPVQATVPLENGAGDLEALIVAYDDELGYLLDADYSFSVQSRVFNDLPYKPFDINSALSQHIIEIARAPLDVRNPQQILSVVCMETKDDEGHTSADAYLGLSLTVHNLSDWAGGMRRFAREAEQVSRSEFKLLEAIEVFELELPARGVVLDLGASPGGWTRILRSREQFVTAVDPGDLDPRVAKDRGVRHKRMTAEEYLARDPDQFDLIVNDMRMDGRDSSRLMVAYAPQLYPGGIALLTLKLPKFQRREILDHCFKILANAYDITGARQLFHNRSEITVYLTRK
ncbi:MAG: 50S rRNA methyltransferase [Caldilineaceae bacterium]|nr:50S rRNA methyltransferase [Caldilineaceae bacterium]